MIGAMPTIGSAETKLPSGSRPRFEKIEPMGKDGDQETRAAADSIARQHAAHEGLNEILAARSAATRRTVWRSRSAPASAPATRRSRARRLPKDRTRNAPNSNGTQRSCIHRSRCGRTPASRRVGSTSGRRRARSRARAARSPMRRSPRSRLIGSRISVTAAASADARSPKPRRQPDQAAPARTARAATTAASRSRTGPYNERSGPERRAATRTPPAGRAPRAKIRADLRGHNHVALPSGAPAAADQVDDGDQAGGDASRRQTAPPRSAPSGHNTSRSAAARRCRPGRRSAIRRRWRRPAKSSSRLSGW